MDITNSRIKGIFIIAVFTFTVSSCEQIIKVNLRSEQPQVVIEGFVTNGVGPFIIKLSESQAYFDQSGFKGIENAQVEMDNSYATENLVDQGSGYYATVKKLRGAPGDIHNLNVTALGHKYSASVVLPPPVKIDTVYFAQGVFDKDSLNAYIEFKDPIFDENYYRIKLFRNGLSRADDYYLITDASADGQKLMVPFYFRYFAPGDTVITELDNLEHSTWLYFQGLSQIVREGFNAQAPGNPPSNITGGALGYFGAWGVSRYKVVIPKSQ
jgi:hypothetical protein